MITILAARKGQLQPVSVDDLRNALSEADARVWIDLQGTGREGFEAIQPALVFHPLVLEDCLVDVNHPKVDDYGDYLYLAVHSARWEESDAEPTLKELDVLVGTNFLLTYHEEPMRSIDHAHKVLPLRPDLLERGPDHLLHFILDVMADNYIPILDTVQGKLDRLEERVFKSATQRVLIEMLRLKRGMAAMRRISGPQRDAILGLTRGEFTKISPEIRPYIRDVYDRMVRVDETVNSFRDELSTLLEIYATQVSNRLNEVMKVLTIITVVIMPVNLIASIYGMNFRMPEQGWPGYLGYSWALGLMVVVGLAMYWFIRSRRWL
jgi:magnesium transporter